MRLSLNITMDNAAFEGAAGPEAARILRELANRIDGSELDETDGSHLRDINGNTVGTWQVFEDSTA